MALKDWEIKTHSKTNKYTEWKKNNKILVVHKERLSKYEATKVWKVSSSNSQYYAYKLLRFFETKSQALKFAKQYMRKH